MTVPPLDAEAIRRLILALGDRLIEQAERAQTRKQLGHQRPPLG